MEDGGTTGHVGFGYSLIYHREMIGEDGPEIWFWFTPLRLSFTSAKTGVRWIWSK